MVLLFGKNIFFLKIKHENFLGPSHNVTDDVDQSYQGIF